jgi:hypothetical protein
MNTKNKMKTIGLALGLTLAACNARPSAPALGEPEAVEAVDTRPRAVVLSPQRGTSNLGDHVSIEVQVTCQRYGACATDQAGTAALLAPRIRLLDGVDATPVVADALPEAARPSPGKTDLPVVLPSHQYRLTFSPVTALRADATYTIELTSDAAVVTGFLDETSAERDATIAATKAPYVQTAAVATGSAPVPVRIEASNDPAKPVTSVRVRFSEPVALSSLVSSASLTTASGESLAACAWDALARRCADAASTDTSDVVDLVFQSPMRAGDLAGGTLGLRANLRGAGGRTLADAVHRLGRGPDGAGQIQIGLQPGAWQPCSTEGDVVCIRQMKM